MTKRIPVRKAAAAVAGLFTAPTLAVAAGLAMVWYGLAYVSPAAAWVVVGAALTFLAVPAARFIR